MGKNKLAELLQRAYKEGFSDGTLCGQQQGFDAAMIYMHRNGFGPERSVKLHHGMEAILDEYADAFHMRMESDIKQVKMDAEIADALKGKLEVVPFPERYPWVKQTNYLKMPKG